jgi:UDP-glucuronate 4-epimerase
MEEVKILITGVAGFVGMHLAKLLLAENFVIIGIDNLNNYYDSELKYSRLRNLGIDPENVEYNTLVSGHNNFFFTRLDIADKENIFKLFEKNKFTIVINLAAQAGVRYSITNPDTYIESNINGFYNIIEACRHFPVDHLLYASSSSVYGNSSNVPFKTNHRCDTPISLYAATKISNELFSRTYSHLYRIPMTGLRFFTVYGPFGRPDMAYYSFTKNIFEGKEILLFNNGDLYRDFTFVSDVVYSIKKLLFLPPSSGDFNRVLNIGNQNPVSLLKFVQILEENIGKRALIKFVPMQPGDVKITYSDSFELEKLINFRPHVSIEDGLKSFVLWYQKYHNTI